MNVKNNKAKLHVSNLYVSHAIAFITKQATLIHSDITQVYFNSTACLYMNATCFGLYLGHPQVCR
jgi:hypothetical protein